MRYIKKNLVYEVKNENIFKDRIYKGAVLISPGIFRDSASKKRIFYSGKILEKSALNWPDPVYLTLDHGKSVLDRVGYVNKIHWNGEKIIGDLHILPITTKSKDIISLIDNNIINSLSIEAMTSESYNKKLGCLELDGIEFIGVSIVTYPACEDSKINN